MILSLPLLSLCNLQPAPSRSRWTSTSRARPPFVLRGGEVPLANAPHLATFGEVIEHVA